MSDDREWSWKVGILHGLGECFWEQSGGVIRKVSRLFINQQGQIGISKSIIGGAFIGLQEIDGTALIVFSVGATNEQAANAKALWSNIIPANGAPRFKLEK